MVDAVSETCRCSWEEVWEKTILETLNIMAYHIDKVKLNEEQIAQWQRTH